VREYKGEQKILDMDTDGRALLTLSTTFLNKETFICFTCFHSKVGFIPLKATKIMGSDGANSSMTSSDAEKKIETKRMQHLSQNPS